MTTVDVEVDVENVLDQCDVKEVVNYLEYENVLDSIPEKDLLHYLEHSLNVDPDKVAKAVGSGLLVNTILELYDTLNDADK